MTDPARTVQRTYLVLTLFTTLATSFIWGINTLFLLDAGLDNTQAFTVNAFFTVGQVLFEVPTGVVADTRGRRFSFLLGSATLLFSTLLYLVMWQVRAGLLGWALASILLGLGFTFFSGATEAWLVDALKATGFRGTLESVFAKAQIVSGVGDADRLRPGRRHRPGHQPRRAIPGPGWSARGDVGDRVPVHARHRLRPEARRRDSRRGRLGPPRLHRRRSAQSAGALADALCAVHGGCRHLRVLRPPAVPPRAVRRPDRLRCRGPRGRDRGRCPDRRRARS